MDGQKMGKGEAGGGEAEGGERGKETYTQHSQMHACTHNFRGYCEIHFHKMASLKELGLSKHQMNSYENSLLNEHLSVFINQ